MRTYTSNFITLKELITNVSFILCQQIFQLQNLYKLKKKSFL